MAIDVRSYVPTLAVRASEMNGLEFLPGATKDRMRPCFLLAPWAASRDISKTIARIQNAYPNEYYFLDIDLDYESSNEDAPAQMQLRELRDPSGAYGNWVEFVREHQWIWPCIQSSGLSQDEIATQIAAFQEMGRPYCMRINRDRRLGNFDELARAFAESGTADFAVILEGGWTNDALTLSAWFDGMLSAVLDRLGDVNVPVIVSCTSIPQVFSAFNSRRPVGVPFTNRVLLEQLRQGTNFTTVVYGDWGSTRPREPGGFASRPVDRIDYPIQDAWFIARNRNDDWTFRETAEVIINDLPEWDGTLRIWGEEMIMQTAISSTLGIDTPQKNVAARVNIHLHRQAFYNLELPGPEAFEEDWRDDL